MFTYLLAGIFIFCSIMLIIVVISLPFIVEHDMNMIYDEAFEIKYRNDMPEEQKIKQFQELTGATIEESKNFLFGLENEDKE